MDVGSHKAKCISRGGRTKRYLDPGLFLICVVSPSQESSKSFSLLKLKDMKMNHKQEVMWIHIPVPYVIMCKRIVD